MNLNFSLKLFISSVFFLLETLLELFYRKKKINYWLI
jgi:hypothetical protein